MTSEATHCQSFSSVGRSASFSISEGQYLVAELGGDRLIARMDVTISGTAILLGDSGATITAKNSSSHNLNNGEFIWE